MRKTIFCILQMYLYQYRIIWSTKTRQLHTVFHLLSFFLYLHKLFFTPGMLYNLRLIISESGFVNLLRSPGIDSQPVGSVRQPYMSYRAAIPRNQFLGSINVYKYGLGNCPLRAAAPLSVKCRKSAKTTKLIRSPTFIFFGKLYLLTLCQFDKFPSSFVDLLLNYDDSKAALFPGIVCGQRSPSEIVYSTVLLALFSAPRVRVPQSVLNDLLRTRLSRRRMIWLLSHLLFPPSSVSNLSLVLSLPVCRRSTDGRGGRGRGWEVAKSHDCEEPWSSINHSIFYAGPPFNLKWTANGFGKSPGH
jgi:hypothetical protein